MRCLLIAAVLARESIVASAQAQDVCRGTYCSDDSSIGKVSFIQKNFEFPRRKEEFSDVFNVSDVFNESSKVIKKEASSQTALAKGFNDQLTEEFAHLASQFFHKPAQKEEDQMGWVPSITMTYDRESWSHTATVFEKSNVCALVFFESLDPFASVDTKKFCKGEGVNVKFTQEMEGFMNLEAWQNVIDFLESCDEVYAVGHSGGGAMATLFAFCANTQATNFGALPEVRLYTLGAPGPAMSALYNGSPGKCFKGVRQFVADEPRAASRAFHVDNLLLFANIADKIPNQAWRSLSLRQAVTKLASLEEGSEEETDLLQKQNVDIGDMWLGVYLVLRGDVQKVNAVLPNYKVVLEAFMEKHAQDLIIDYDPVPQMFIGYLHPLVKAQPIANTKVSPSGVAVIGPAVECDADMPQVPNFDYAQLAWGSLRFNKGHYVEGGSIPNHGACCAMSEADCSSRYEDTSDIVCRLFSKENITEAPVQHHH